MPKNIPTAADDPTSIITIRVQPDTTEFEDSKHCPSEPHCPFPLQVISAEQTSN